MNEQLHFITQYLATAGKSFMVHRPDDSHTNVGFNSETQSFETWDLNKAGLKLVFDVPRFELRWSSNSSQGLLLDGKNHKEVVAWLKSSARQVGLEKPYRFDLHYDLPFEWDNFAFQLGDPKEVEHLTHLRILADDTLDAFLKAEKLQSDIRVWPHHFDTGAFVVLNDGSGKSIGMGMAIPDSLVNDHYFYISGYLGHDGLDTSSFNKLTSGEWKNEGFKGAILSVNNLTKKNAVQFLQEAYYCYRN